MTDSRQIRIFISSTFKDMQAERDYLITKVFPRLQAEAAKRDVTIIPLDLRWGITEEESKTGKVLQICLQEIENSRPFFIGLLGNRYGWIPSKEELRKNEILQERWGAWLDEDFKRELSVTEIEMQYGVLRSDKEINAFFYIREGEPATDESTEKLERLKAAVRNNGKHPVHNYDNPQQLGKLVEDDFLDMMNRLYPEQQLSALEKERLAQQSFVHSRTEIYVPDEESLSAIDRFCEDPATRGLAVTAESGMGKSALLANWISKHRGERAYNVIYHFVGGGYDGGSAQLVMQHLVDEVTERYGLTPINTTDDLTQQMDELFNVILDEKPLVIVLDGINQLADTGHAKQLAWLPVPTNNIKYIISTLSDDPTMETLRHRGFERLNLQPLNEERRERLVVDYLGRYKKTLLPRQIGRIVDDAQSENTFVLRTLLDELVSFGVHEQLDNRIDYYLSADSIKDFFMRVLERFEYDYGKDDVTTFLMLIACAKNGLSENEILALTGRAPLVWSQFYCAFRAHFLTRNGRIVILHQWLTAVIMERYGHAACETRDNIVRFFSNTDSERAYSELAYQYMMLHDGDALYGLLSDYVAFEAIYKENHQEAARYWRYLLASDPVKYAMTVYSDISRAVEVNRHKRVDHLLLANFLIDHFRRSELAKEHLLLYEWGDGYTLKNEADVTPVSTVGLTSVRMWYNLARAARNDEEAILYLNNAVSHFEATQEVYAVMPSLLEHKNEILNMVILGKGSKEQEKEFLNIFNAYMLRGDVHLRLGEMMEAAITYTKAVEMSRRFLKQNTRANALALLKVSEYKSTLAMSQPSITGREAYEASAPYADIRVKTCYNLARQLTLQPNRTKDETDEANALCDEMYALAVKHWGKDRKEYGDTMFDIAKIQLLLSQFDNCLYYLELGSDDTRKLAFNARQPVVDDMGVGFRNRIGDLSIRLGELYSKCSAEKRNIAKAHFYLKMALEKGALTEDDPLWQQTEELRKQQLRAFADSTADFDDEYLCQLVFPLDCEPLSDDYFTTFVESGEFAETDFFQSYNALISLENSYFQFFPTANIEALIKEMGATEVFHRLKLSSIRCWRQLRADFPEQLAGVDLSIDNDVLDVAEATDNADLQMTLVSLLGFMIDMEGVELQCELEYHNHRLERIKKSIDWREFKENDHSAEKKYKENSRANWMKALSNYQDTGYSYLKKNLDFCIALYGTYHPATALAYRKMAKFCKESQSVIYPPKADAFLEKAKEIEEHVTRASQEAQCPDTPVQS